MQAVLRRALSIDRRPRNQRTAELFPAKCVAYQTFLSAKRSMPAGNVPRKSRRHDAPLPRRHRLVTLERFPKFCIPRMPNSPTCGFCHLTHIRAPTLHRALHSVFTWPITSPSSRLILQQSTRAYNPSGNGQRRDFHHPTTHVNLPDL